MPMLSPYQGASTWIYLFLSSLNSPTDRHTSSPTSLQDQSNCTMFNCLIILYVNLEKYGWDDWYACEFSMCNEGCSTFDSVEVCPYGTCHLVLAVGETYESGMLWAVVLSLVSISTSHTPSTLLLLLIFSSLIWCPSGVLVKRIWRRPALITLSRVSEWDWDLGSAYTWSANTKYYLPTCLV